MSATERDFPSILRILYTSGGGVDDVGCLAVEAIVYATTVKPLSLFHRLTVSKGLCLWPQSCKREERNGYGSVVDSLGS
jgi:hypothetical protein